MAHLGEVPLGPTNGSKRIHVNVDIHRLEDIPVTSRALYDTGSDLNIISHDLATQWKLPKAKVRLRPEAFQVSGIQLTLLDAYSVTTTATDRNGTPRTIPNQVFWSSNISGYDLILGLPWQYQADAAIDPREGNFQWWDRSASVEERVFVDSQAEDLLTDLEEGERAYVLYPGSFHARSLTVEETRAILWPDPGDPLGPEDPDREPDKTHQGGGDQEQTAENLHRQGLLWLFNLKKEIETHLTKCVKDYPELSWLPKAMVARVATAYRDETPQRATRPREASPRRWHPPGTSRPVTETIEGMDPEDIKLVPECLHDQLHVFNAANARQLMAHSEHDHAIDIEPGKTPPNMPIYNLSARELEILKEYLETAQDKGWIRPSKSPIGAPILFAPKSDGTLRLCVDFRGLNKVTVKNRYPIPLVNEMLDRLSRAKVFSKLDLRDAYHRMRIKEGDEWKTAFKTRYGHFEYQVMPFGLTNAPATFQAYINKCLGGLVDITCVVYLDDILIYSEKEEDHERHVREVLERLFEWNLYAKASKCTFFTKSVEFLGFIVTPQGVVMDPVRVQTIREWPEPKRFRDIQVFLGFANFYRRFIFNYSEVVRPLVNHMVSASSPDTSQAGSKKKTTRQNQKGPTKWYKPWTYPDDVREAFLALRELFTKAPVLQHFDPRKSVMLLTDASEFAMAGIVLQPISGAIGTEKHWKPVAFHSRKFAGPQIRWDTHDKELWAIVECFRTWRHYFEYAPDTIRVLTDHHNLKYFMTTKSLTPKQARWAEELARFDFEIEHKPGASNPADAPSRRPDYAEGFQLGEGKRLRDIMLPTLQNKLRVWAIRTPKAPNSNAGGTTAGRILEEGSPEGDQTHPEHIANHSSTGSPGNEPVTDDTSSTDPEPPTGVVSSPEARWDGEEESIAEALHRDLRTCSSHQSAQAAAQTDAPFDLEVSGTLSEHVREVQEGDVAYHRNVLNVEMGKQGKGRKGAPAWSTDPTGVLRRAGKVWIPQSKALRQALLTRNHDDPLGGHYGKDKTVELLQRKYYWPGLRADVDKHIKGCVNCQVNKTRRHKPWGFLESIPPAAEPWRHFSLDFITDLPPAKGGEIETELDSILVLVDRFTKYVRYIPVSKSITAKALAEILFEQVFIKHGPPDSLISDRGSVFTSEFWTDVCFHMNVTLRMSTAFHPQTDGQTERMNQELEAFLRMYVNYQQDDWIRFLSTAEYAYNSKIHSSHGKCPIEVAYGIKPKGFDGMPDEFWLRPPPEDWDMNGKTPQIRRAVEGYLANRSKTWQETTKALEHSQKAQQRWYNAKRTEMHFSVGDKVLLRSLYLKTKRPSKKLDAKYLGPFTIVKRHGKLAYRLELPPGMSRVHPVFHVSLLEKFHPPREDLNFQPGPVELEEDNEHFEVEAILAHKESTSGKLFLVKWLGWGNDSNTWEPEEHLDNCELLLQEYWQYPDDQTMARARRGRPAKSTGLRRSRRVTPQRK